MTILYQVRSYRDYGNYDFHDKKVYLVLQQAEKRQKELQELNTFEKGTDEYVIGTLDLIND